MEFFGGWLLPLMYAIGCLLVFGQSRHHWKIARLTAAAALLATGELPADCPACRFRVDHAVHKFARDPIEQFHVRRHLSRKYR